MQTLANLLLLKNKINNNFNSLKINLLTLKKLQKMQMKIYNLQRRRKI